MEFFQNLFGQSSIAVGTLVTGAVLSAVLPFVTFSEEEQKKVYSNPVALKSDQWQEFTLIEVEEISHDVRRFRFALQSPEHVLGLPIGQHISFKFEDDNGKVVQRSYTPVSSDDELGYVDFVIKVYFSNVHPKYPEGGKMSQYVNSLKVGDALLMRGPKGVLEYQSLSKKGDHNGGMFRFKPHGKEAYTRKVLNLGMIAGGTGITPMLQVIRAVIKNKGKDRVNLWLIYGNQTEEDILLRSELDNLVVNCPEVSFHVHYTLDRPPSDGSWKYSTGFVNTEMCREHLPAASLPNTMVFMCGPGPMIRNACEPALKTLGFDNSQCFTF